MSDSALHEPKWPALWVRAAMRTAILACLEAGPLHGYAIALALEGIGFGRPKGGSLYPILEELKTAGSVVDEWEQSDGGPGRRVYRLTEDGRERLKRERGQWRELADSLAFAGMTGNGANQPSNAVIQTASTSSASTAAD